MPVARHVIVRMYRCPTAFVIAVLHSRDSIRGANGDRDDDAAV
jgi:hypothetical protein